MISLRPSNTKISSEGRHRECPDLVCCILLFDGVLIRSALLPNEDARCVALNDVAFLQMAHGRLPPCREPLLQDLRCLRLVVPDRDLLHRAESGRSVHKPSSARKWHQDVMSKLVLLDDVGWMDWR